MMSTQTNTYHIPVLLDECLEGLHINPTGIYVDLTFGGGSHSRAILDRLAPSGQLFAFDKDKDAIANAIEDDRFCLINDDYANMTKQLRLYRVTQVDGILADLGISSHQIDTSQRGFTFRDNGPLDLRMNTDSTFTAADIINSYSEEKLSQILFSYAEIPSSRRIARQICKKREEQYISTTEELCNAIRMFTKPDAENKFFARIFQALRIEVNNELVSLDNMLMQCADILKPNGRLVIISYHSLEDKRVKQLMKSGDISGEIVKDFYGNVLTPYELITRKPITPSSEELSRNPRSRSAKLRIAQKKGNDK